MKKFSCPGLTLDEALSDPLVRAVSRADGVDPDCFEMLLRSAAGVIAQRRRQPAMSTAELALAC